MIDLDKLEEMAKAATPGPWVRGPYGWVYVTGADTYAVACCATKSGPMRNSNANEDFIAAANPAAVLEMVDLIRKQEAALAGVQARIGGLMLAQAGLVEALKEGAEYLEGVAKKTTSNAVWAHCDSIAGDMRKAIAAAGVTL